MKILTVSVFIVATSFVQAQNIGNSPYASQGIGDLKYDNSVETRSMGGISTAYVWDFNNQFNFQNPAANGNLELSSIKIQGTNENLFLESKNAKYTEHSTYVSGLSIAFPFSKRVKFGVSYQPYSSKDYQITEEISLNNTKGLKKIYGEGGINLVQAGLGVSLSNSLSIGITSNLYFGKLYNVEEVSYQNNPLISEYEKILNINNFNFTAGAIYQKRMKNNKKFTLGATYTFGNTSDFKETHTNSTYSLSNQGKDYQSVIPENKIVKNTLPQELSVGMGFGHDAKWFLGTQFNYKIDKNTIQKQDNAYKIAVGGWFLPNYNNFRNYFSRVTYRYGAFYEKNNLKIKNTNIDKYGISFGGSFPFQKSNIHRLSSIDLGVELGQRGTLENNFIKENFINLTVGINFANKWFEKQYFD
ncbi:MAG: hypothetical protein Q4A00_05980 [Flavobacteriaceae bacterium]|nr:hypothetical protein [Flavobacteriaceae bacterium]